MAAQQPSARSLFRWLGAAGGAAPVLAAAEIGFVAAGFPAASSDGRGLASWYAVVAGLYALPGMLLATGAWLLTRRARPPVPHPAVLLGAATTALAAGQLIHRFDAYVATRPVRDFPERLALAQAATAVALAALAIALGTGVYRGVRRLSASWTPASYRMVLAGVASAGVAYLLAVAHLGLGPIHMRSLAVGCSLAALGLALLVGYLLLPTRSSSALAVALCVEALLPMLGPLRDPHARFVLFAHSPVAGTLAAGLRDALDQDGDGSPSVAFGGADCDDSDPARGTAQREVPGDGVDQDCRGGDAALAPPAAVRTAAWPGCALPSRPSILLVTVDAFRADYLRPGVTPYMDRMRAVGLAFERAYTATTLTRSSFPSLLSGRNCSAFASANPAVDQRATLGTTLPDVLRSVGYRTIGFNYFETPAALEGEFDAFNAAFMDPTPGQARVGRRAASLTNAVLAVTASTAAPWFVWVHYPDAHAPYLDESPRAAELPDAERYAHELAYVDLHVGRLVTGLATRGQLESTVVVIAADHGEALGQGGHEGHGSNVLEGTIHVPLLMVIPGCAARSVRHPVSMTRLAATLATLAGARLGGPDLLAPAEAAGPVVSEAIMLPDGRLLRALLRGDDKLVVDVRNGGRMAFDLADDPGETRNVYSSDERRREALERAYQAWLDALPYR